MTRQRILYRIALVLFVCILVLHGTHIRNRDSVAVPGVDWLVLARLSVCGLAFVVGILLIPKPVSWGFGGIIAILYVLATGISALNSPYFVPVFGYFILLAGAATLMLALVYHAQDLARLEKIQTIWFLTLAVLVVKDALTAMFFFEGPSSDGYGRLGMGVTHATELSLFSALLFWMSFRFEKGRWRLLLWLWRIFLIYVMIAAKSRVSILGFAAAGGCYFLLSTRDALKRGMVVSCAGCLMVFFLLAVTFGQTWASGMSDYLQRGQDTKELSSLTGRTYIWRHVLKRLPESPIAGNGYGVSRLTMGEVRQMNWEPHHCQNELLEVFFNTGLLGLVPFVAMFIYNLKWIWDSSRLQDVFSRTLALNAMCLSVMLLISSVFEIRLSSKLTPIQPLFFFYLMTLDREGYLARTCKTERERI